VITDGMSLAEGVIVDRGTSLTTGAQPTRVVPPPAGRPGGARRRGDHREPDDAEPRKKLELAARFRRWLGTVDPGTRWGRTGIDCGACRALDYCADRGCDGREQRAGGGTRVIWRGKRRDGSRIEVTTCPVLAFTPEVTLALERFDDTHVLVNADGRFWWQPLGPMARTEESRATHAMTFLRRVHDDLVRPATKAPAATDEP
jgi:hypothetical protein